MNSTENNNISPGALVGGGHYSLHVPLGESGLLWLAQDEELQRLAVVRFLPSEIRQDARALETLKKRAVAAGNVTHENVCRVLEWYESAAVETFLATEYVEGKPVTEVMNGGEGKPVPWDWLKPVAASVACGLEALHRAGVVHHGVRPEDIMVAADKRVKLLNVVTTGSLKNPLFAPGALNQPNDLRCFSPQQLAGQEPTPADDFYSLGATLFELLTGTAVFSGANLLQDISSTPAPTLRERLTAVKAQPVPDAIVDFITACLNKDAAQRPKALDCLLPRRAESIPVAAPAQSAKAEKPAEKVVPLRAPEASTPEVLPQLHSRSELELIRAARDARPRRSPWAIAAVVFLFLALGGVLGFFQLQRQDKEQKRMVVAALEQSQQREQAEQNARLVEEKLKQETLARKKSEDEARKAKEAARLAEERRRAEAETLARRERELAGLKKASEPEPKKFVPPPVPSVPANGDFVSMFNGRDLTDWSGNTKYWSVKDGCITAQSMATEPKDRFLLKWEKGNVGDFEMHFSYRFRVLRGNRSPNGGVNYRMNGTTNVTAYQFDLVTNPKDNGSVQDDRKRNRLAGYGDAAEGTSSNKHPVLLTLGDTNKLNAIKPEDWNKCVIIAQSNRLTHYINGVLVADVTEVTKSKRHTNGAIALELYTRNTNNAATFLQFSDLKIKRLEPPAKGPGLVSASR
jgi:serine/threonine protein kinase